MHLTNCYDDNRELATGELNYSKACGVRTLDPNGAQPFELDAVCYIASMTKLMTTVAAMQTVERGLIALDDDVSDVLHEWKNVEILDGFDESGKAIMHKAKNKVTLRQVRLFVIN
jgi:CubicO group peptidase (beta-lactamase class C family)